MRIVAFILSIVLTAALMMSGEFVLVFASPQLAPGWLAGLSLALAAEVFSPLVLGSFRAYWDVAGSPESRQYFRRVALIVLSVEVAAVVLAIVFAISHGAGPLLPVVFAGGGAVLTAVALVAGAALFRREQVTRAAPVPWIGIDRLEVRRALVRTAIAFVAVVVAMTIVFGVLDAAFPAAFSLGDRVRFTLEFALMIASLMCLVPTIGWNRRLRDLVSRDPSRLRRISRVVVRGKGGPLDAGDEAAAARYASVASVTLSFQTAYIVMLYGALSMNSTAFSDDSGLRLFGIVLVFCLVTGLLVLVPLQISYVRRARRYARDHADLLAPETEGLPQPLI